MALNFIQNCSRIPPPSALLTSFPLAKLKIRKQRYVWKVWKKRINIGPEKFDKKKTSYKDLFIKNRSRTVVTLLMFCFDFLLISLYIVKILVACGENYKNQ